MVVIFTFVLTHSALGQERSIRINTIEADSLSDTLSITDTSLIQIDSLTTDSTLTADSTKKVSLEERLGIKLSPDALDEVVKSEAKDSAVLNMQSNVFHLYGNAKVNYQDMELKAGTIIYQQSENLVTAAPLQTDTFTKLKDRPSFTQGSESFTYDSIKYNFKSKRAIVRNPRTQYGNGYVYSDQIKRNPDQSIYGLRNLYTTCALDTPHFGIKAKKIKVIPGRVVASGAANINIENVPTPLFLPFGLFPISKGQRSGFILPTYTIEEARGVGLLGGGYYFNFGDYADLETRANIYSKGSWQVSGSNHYAKRYKYQGGLTFTYNYVKTGEDYEVDATQQRDFNVQWRHQSDPKSRPGSNFTASVNAGTSSFNTNATYDATQILNNQYRSNIAYQKTWANKPFTLGIGASHSQEASTGQVNVTLPDISFFVNQFNPFQGKNSLGTKWYEKITASYTFTAQNQLNFTDSLFNFNKLSFSDFRNGMKHSVPINATYNIFRFIQVGIGGNYNEYWLTKQTFKGYDYTGDSVAVTTYNGFYTARDYNVGINLNTRIYGLKMFKKGGLMGIRHVLIPTVGLNYVPDFAKDPYRFGYETIIDPNAENTTFLSPYEGAILGAPTQLGNYSSVVSFALDNNLQIKVRSNGDSTGSKNIRLIDNFKLSTGYNLAVDSFNWSDLSLSFNTMFFNVVNVRASAQYDLYAFDYEEERRVNTTMFQKGTGIARFKTANVSLDASLKPRERQNEQRNISDTYNRLQQWGITDRYYDFDIPWNVGVTYVLGINKSYLAESKKDTVQISNHNIGFNGQMNLTSRWKLTVNTSYNVAQKKLQMTQINIVRDLHCWEMVLSVIPFGDRKFYNFTLNVKASELQDLKILRRRDFRDAIF